MQLSLPGNPEAAGLSPKRLDHIRARMLKHIDAGRMVGGIGLIARRGHVGYFETWGMSDREAAAPMREDAIFRIFSMTKAVTAVAAMMLFEEGAFALADPVSNFLPEFGHMRVAVEAPEPSTGKMVLAGSIPAVRAITVLDLMRHTAGFNYTGPPDADGNATYDQRGIQPLGDITSAEFVKRLAEVPLVREPGTAWDYGFGTDVLGRIVEVISGGTLAEFFAKRIFEPLGMVDTAFHVDESQWRRLVPIYAPEPGWRHSENDRYVAGRVPASANDALRRRRTHVDSV